VLWLSGKDEVLDLANLLSAHHVAGCVALIDADQNRYFGRQRQGANVCWTDKADLESTLISSDAFFRILPDSHDNDTKGLHRELLVEAGLPIGILRAVSAREEYGLDFKNICYGAFINPASITADRRACCEEVVAKNPQTGLSADDLDEEIKYIRRGLVDSWLLLNGHDLCRIANLCSQRIVRRPPSHERAISKSLLVNYTEQDFNGTSTFREIEDWQKQNPGFRMLRP
jgi:hypothetical protein